MPQNEQKAGTYMESDNRTKIAAGNRSHQIKYNNNSHKQGKRGGLTGNWNAVIGELELFKAGWPTNLFLIS